MSRARFRPLLENLEGRWCPSGNVQVFLDSAGDLNIVGDSRSNGVAVDQGPNDVPFTIRALEAGTAPTRLNGVLNGSVQFEWADVNNIKVSLGGGNDLIKVNFFSDEVNARANVHIDTGTGNDNVDFVSSIWIAGDLRIKTGSGADSVHLFSTNVAGDEIIETGSGADRVNIEAGSKVGGNLTIRTGTGSDFVRLSESIVKGDTFIDTDGPSGFGEEKVYINSSTFEGNFALTTRGGSDYAQLHKSTFHSGVGVSMGWANDGLCVNGSTFLNTAIGFDGGGGAADERVADALTGPVSFLNFKNFEFELDDGTYFPDFVDSRDTI
jgi:hypothetical protein